MGIIADESTQDGQGVGECLIVAVTAQDSQERWYGFEANEGRVIARIWGERTDGIRDVTVLEEVGEASVDS
jgi:hypothetical protein